VLGQIGIDAKTSEVAAFAPLLDTIVGLAEVVVTADALHTQREHVGYLHERGAHWVLTVKGTQPTLRRQLAALPWRALPSRAPPGRDQPRPPGDPHDQGRHHRRRHPVPARRPSNPARPPLPPGLRTRPVAHRDRLCDH
jgi:hypothetical protein